MNKKNALDRFFLSCPPSPDREWIEHDLDFSPRDEGVSWRIPDEEATWRSNYNDAPGLSLSLLLAHKNAEWKESIPTGIVQLLLEFEEHHCEIEGSVKSRGQVFDFGLSKSPLKAHCCRIAAPLLPNAERLVTDLSLAFGCA